jgi:threonine/homoserine/homoserine lactone efflux protein
MKYLLLFSAVLIIWMAYEIWRAPLMEETEDGKLITKRPTRKLSDLWRKQS